MARRARKDEPEPEDEEGGDADDASVARDFVMARMLAARSSLAAALASLDEAADLFVDPHDDGAGKKRKEALEGVDQFCGAAAASIQLAMAEFKDIDPKEGEPDAEDGGS